MSYSARTRRLRDLSGLYRPRSAHALTRNDKLNTVRISYEAVLNTGKLMIPKDTRTTLRQRKPPHQVNEASEDAGLFQTAICEVMVELIPQTRRNDRGDFVVRGYVDRKFEVDVFFAGRRTAETGPLESQLKALLRASRAIALAAKNPAPKIETLRLPVRIEGSWRRSMKRDDTGWETSTHHLVAVRWSLLDQDGNTLSFGKPPAI